MTSTPSPTLPAACRTSSRTPQTASVSLASRSTRNVSSRSSRPTSPMCVSPVEETCLCAPRNAIRLFPPALLTCAYSQNTGNNAPENEDSKRIAAHLIHFLEEEVAAGRMPRNLHPLQRCVCAHYSELAPLVSTMPISSRLTPHLSVPLARHRSGIGNVANSIIGGLAESKFEQLQVWTEVVQDRFLPLIDSGRLSYASATSIRLSKDGFRRLYDDWDRYFDKLLLRPQQVANSPEIIRRLGVIAMNTPLEVDMYGHANSTCALGSRMLNGLGGSADFLRNAKLVSGRSGRLCALCPRADRS